MIPDLVNLYYMNEQQLSRLVSASVETHYRYIINCDTRPGQLTFHEETADIMISQCIGRDPLEV